MKIAELASTSHLSKATTKKIIKDHFKALRRELGAFDEAMKSAFVARITKMTIIREINSNIGFVTLKSVQLKFDESSISVYKSYLSKTMKQELILRWKKARSMDAYVNLEKNIKHRQQFALMMVELMASEKLSSTLTIFSCAATRIRPTAGVGGANRPTDSSERPSARSLLCLPSAREGTSSTSSWTATTTRCLWQTSISR